MAADTLFTTPEMAAIFSGEALIARMLAFEGALARAEGRLGVIPEAAAAAIAAACRPEAFEVATILHEAGVAGTAAIPLVRMLTARVEPDSRGYVHWGATSQDVIDTASVLQVRDGLDRLERGLLAIGEALAALADRHRTTPMAGRTLLQQALPITFGLKAARWLGLTNRLVRQLRAARREVLVVQLGGAAGTLASLGGRGVEVMAAVAAELGLGVPDLPWHAERDRVAALAGALGTVAGGMAKIARDVALLMQSEVGEALEGAAAGKGGSSTLPHKRNPVDATFAVAAARLAIGLVPVVLGAMETEHERPVGGWQAEWAALPELFGYTAGAVARTGNVVAGLEVQPERMRANLELTRGQIMAEALSMALAPALGRDRAFALAQAVARRAAGAGSALRDAALADPEVRGALSAEAIERALEPTGYLGSTEAFIDRALAEFRALHAAAD